MSKKVELDLTCPQCRRHFKGTAFRTIWVELPENLELILNDQINVVRCSFCGFKDKLQFAFLATNVKKRVAVWFEPAADPQIDADLALYKQHYGVDSFWAKAPRIRDWDQFKQTLVKLNSQADVPATVKDLARIVQAMKSASQGNSQSITQNPSESDKLARLIDGLRAKGHKIPSMVSQIPDFPCPSFAALKAGLARKDLVLLRPTSNYNSEVFSLLANRSESTAFKAALILMYLFPVISLLLAVFAHWTLALLCPVFIFSGWKLGRTTYMRTLTRSATDSEMKFCFLFYGYKIGVASADFSKEYVWQG